jgi:hypothetical protein
MTFTFRAWRLPWVAGLACGLASPAFALSFNVGGIEGQFDSAFSIGSAWSTQSPDKNLVGAVNGGHGLSSSNDDGRLNFHAGQAFSQRLQGVHELELKRGDSGLFVRGKYWYDFKLADDDLAFKNIDDAGRKTAARSSGVQLLDAFVYHNYSIGELPGVVRVGKQVVSWGENRFLGNSIDSINPVDVTALRRPGAPIKQALVPVNLFYLSQDLSDNWSAEGFYQLEWDQTVADNCGTFFARSDVLADGCAGNLAVPRGWAGASGRPGSPDEGLVVARGPDRDARDSGQFGIASHYRYDPLDTEFGIFFMNTHSRLPIFSGHAGSAALALPTAASYFVEYPEDIQLYGLSFSSTLPEGTVWSGELSYRPNAPVQLNSTDVLLASLAPSEPGLSRLRATEGSDLHGYRRKEITQLQSSLSHVFDQIMGAERLTTTAEVGWTHVGGLEGSGKARYGRDASYGPGPLANGNCAALNGLSLAGAAQNNRDRYCENDGFTTEDSWGYRARVVWEYDNVFAGINLKPNLAWSHDVRGYSPNPGGNFEEGRKAVSLGLDADYQGSYTASLAYTNFFDGQYTSVDDRDFLALSVGMSF